MRLRQNRLASELEARRHKKLYIEQFRFASTCSIIVDVALVVNSIRYFHTVISRPRSACYTCSSYRVGKRIGKMLLLVPRDASIIVASSHTVINLLCVIILFVEEFAFPPTFL